MSKEHEPHGNVVHIESDIADLVPDYLSNRRADLLTIRDCLIASDFEAIRRLGHQMRGSGASYGFDYLTAVGTEIEIAARSNDVDALKTQVDALEAYLSDLTIVFE